jgi:Spy/CpxP family protein refolding chaperone
LTPEQRAERNERQRVRMNTGFKIHLPLLFLQQAYREALTPEQRAERNERQRVRMNSGFISYLQLLFLQ